MTEHENEDLREAFDSADSLDDMIDLIKTTHTRLEKLHAEYLPHFPDESATIYLLNVKLDSLIKDPAYKPRHDASTGKEVMPAHMAFDIREELNRKKMQYADGFSPVERIKLYTEKILFRKINQACHPDRTAKFGRRIVMKLRETMNDAQMAYSRRDYDTLELLWIRVCYLRDELHKLDKAMLERVTKQKRLLELDLQGIMSHPLYRVLDFHTKGYVFDAKREFARFLADHIARINAEIVRWTEIRKTEVDLGAQ